MSGDYGLAEAMAGARFREYAKVFLRIEDENGVICPFVLNEAQEIVDQVVENQLSEGRPVRVLILKGRQQGMSTYCQGRLTHRAFTTRSRSITVGHVLPAVHELWGKLDRCWKELANTDIAKKLKSAGIDLQPPLEPGMGDKGRRTVFADPLGSVCRYDSAADPESVGRGMTIQVAHLTEIPQWAKPDETMQAVLATIPDHPSTMVFVETTAKGASGWFYEAWCSAMEKVLRGESPDFYPVFVPWFVTKRYARKRRQGEPQLDKREKSFRDQYKLTNEQCYWYRDQREKYGERVTEEYPSNWQEAFLSSGLPFFRREILAEYRELSRDRSPERVGQFRIYDAVKAIWEKMHGGPTHIYADPEPDHRYVMGVDFASGRAGDFSAIVVIDADTRQVVVTHKSKWLPDQVLDEAILLGKAYNMALIVPERSGIGQSLVDRLVNDIGYRNVYRETDPVSVKYHRGTRYGWATSNSTRKWLLEGLAKVVHRKEIGIPCQRITDEMDVFVYTDEDGEHASAADGKNDDLVFALAFAVRGMNTLPPVAAKKSDTGTNRRHVSISSRTGY